MPALDPLAVRVARRHAQAAVVLRGVPAPTTRIEYSDGGRISAIELMRMLRPELGVLVKLVFRPSLTIDPNGIEWEALTENAELVTGRVVLHAAVGDDEVVSWAEFVIHGRPVPGARVAVEYQRRPEGLVAVGDDEEDG